MYTKDKEEGNICSLPACPPSCQQPILSLVLEPTYSGFWHVLNTRVAEPQPVSYYLLKFIIQEGDLQKKNTWDDNKSKTMTKKK